MYAKSVSDDRKLPFSGRSAACKTGLTQGVSALRLRGMADTILVVEDDPNIGALVKAYVERDGYTALWVRSGEEALAELPRHPVRLVVLDIGLPGIDGFEVCRRIAGRVRRDADGPRRGCRSVAGLELGADDYVPKPFSPRS